MFDFGCDVNSLSIFVHLHSLLAVLIMLKKFVCAFILQVFFLIGIIMNVKLHFSLNAFKSVSRCFLSMQ